MHTYIENEVMYPRVRELLPDLEDDVLESYEEHHVADVLVMELVRDEARRRAVRRQDHGADRERRRTTSTRRSRTGSPRCARAWAASSSRRSAREMLEARKKAPDAGPSQPSALKKTIDAVIA